MANLKSTQRAKFFYINRDEIEKLIEKDGISYYDFKELKNAVEELGGEYKGSKFTSVKQIH